MRLVGMVGEGYLLDEFLVILDFWLRITKLDLMFSVVKRGYAPAGV